MIRRILYRPFFIRLFNWEYWPFYAVYGPILLYWFWLCIKSRSFFFFNTSNPSITNGGFMMESKRDIYKIIPDQYYPETLFFSAGTESWKVINSLYKNHIQYPVIGKPDIGMKGIAVKKLDNEVELTEYVSTAKFDFLIQKFVEYKNEVGIFYYRYPGQQNGAISGIVSKEFLSVIGNGQSTIEELLYADKRYILQLPVLRKMYTGRLQRILPAEEEFILVPYGNHVRGAKFVDASHLIDDRLTRSMDAVCQQVDGFYFGRLDIRYNTWEDLRNGKNFSIIELNGAGSEPTHIYDPKHSIFFAWKEIIRHWKILSKVSKLNHDKTHRPYMNTKDGLDMLRQNKAYIKMIEQKAEKRA